jgi:hypothetical protein
MKREMFIGIGGISIIATSISIYNYYRLPVIRHEEIINKVYGIDNKEIIDKVYGIDKSLKK